VQNQIPVYDIKNLKEQIKEQQITVAILAVPAEKAQELTDQLLEVGIQGILNFTTVPLTVPEKVIVQDVDLSVELQSLIYGINRREIEELE
jgi:redox-sensing transcriptional repressor